MKKSEAKKLLMSKYGEKLVATSKMSTPYDDVVLWKYVCLILFMIIFGLVVDVGFGLLFIVVMVGWIEKDSGLSGGKQFLKALIIFVIYYALFAILWAVLGLALAL